MEKKLQKHEVRVGNYLLIHNSSLSEGGTATQSFSPVLVEDGYFIDQALSKCKGIKLSSSLLTFLEFEVSEEDMEGGIGDLLTYYTYNGYCFMEDFRGKFFLVGYNWNTKHLEYFHELQNLYLDLSGYELVESSKKLQTIEQFCNLSL